MDSALPRDIIIKRKRKITSILVIVVLLLAFAAWLLRSTLSSTIQKSAFTTAVVEKGDVENTISASGLVQPEFEAVITSPVNASIQNTLMNAGSKIKAGQSILTLDKSATQNEYEKLQFQLASKKNDIQKLKLELAKSFYDIKSNNDIKQLRINSLEAEVENAKRLFKAGGGTKESIEQAELNLKVALLEKKQIENEIASKQQTMQVEIKESELAAAIQQNDLQQLERKLKLADIVAGRDGVVTWINRNIGVSVREGDVLAKIADLGSFKIAGSITDNYIDQLHNGMQAIIRINDTKIRGTVNNVYPSVQNGIVSFDIRLEDRSNTMLRPDMKVDIFLVTASHNNVMRVENGQAFKGASPQEVFVVTNGKAVRKTVHTGMSNFDYIELLDNVHPGDVIITSDMSDFKNVKEVTIEN